MGVAQSWRRRVMVVGSGISSLSCANPLASDADVTLFEAAHHFGGHARTVDFNQRTCPQLIRLFADLRIETVASEMSFSVQHAGLEWLRWIKKKYLATPRR